VDNNPPTYGSRALRLGAPLTDFLLAARRLPRASVVSLLLSSSFGLNALFYAAWLGYTIGAWALVIQAAWALSFVLLVPFAKSFYDISSLHDLLGRRYGTGTRVVAAFCSLAGMIYLVGWEVGIARGVFTSFFETMPGAPLGGVSSQGEIFIVGIVLVTLAYTASGGLTGNAKINLGLNAAKLILTFVLIGFSVVHLYGLAGDSWAESAFPSFGSALSQLGLWGILTNVLFNLSWQFVDNSSWQSIIGGSRAEPRSVQKNLKWSGAVIFMTIGLLGTALGIGVSALEGLTPEQVLVQAAVSIPANVEVVMAILVGLVAVCVMSLVDGMLLACALTAIGDILPATRFGSRMSDVQKLRAVRFTLVVSAVIAVWGIDVLIRWTGGTIFDFVYIVVITQLSLLGPVVFCWVKGRGSRWMWIAIPSGLAIGFGAAIIGVTTSRQYLVDGAGTFTILASCLTAGFIHLLVDRRTAVLQRDTSRSRSSPPRLALPPLRRRGRKDDG
jgi:hypothetical protein